MSRPPPLEEPNLVEALWRVLASVLATLQHRLELATLEAGEASNRFMLTLVTSLAALALLCAAGLALSAWLAVALWPTLGPAVLGWIALGYALVAAGLIAWLRARLRALPPLMSETLAELRNDEVLVRGTDRP